MKLKLMLAVAFVVTILAGATFAQSVGITAKKVTYTRKKPIADHKKTFEITYPKIKAKTPAISRKIEAILSYEKAFDFKLAEELGEIQWLESASYSVDYNANKLLSVSLMIEGSGAYPSGSTKYFVIDSTTGTRVVPATVFVNTAGLLAKVKKLKEAEVKKALEDIKNDPETKDDDVSSFFTSSDEYSKVSLNEMSIDENGVVFHHDYGFPHVAKALQPTGEFFLTWEELKPYIKKNGLLAQFVR